MKKETKELIDWIKKQINIVKENCIDVVWNGKHEYYNADYEKAMKFLDSLPQIESHLCKGGYVQDRNGTPCCDRDKVKFTPYTVWGENNSERIGRLHWSTLKKFIFVSDDEYETAFDFEDVYEFEKNNREK